MADSRRKGSAMVTKMELVQEHGDPRKVTRVKVVQPMIEITGLNHWFGSGETRKQGLADNNLTLMPGEMVVMTGPSGSGKTTILTLIGALRTIQEGSVKVHGRELFGLSPRALTDVRRDIGFIFQAHNLFDSLTAFQNVRM